VLRLPDHWLWDFWFADDGELFHLFFLKAPRRLGDPDLRHWNVSIGHAVSGDLAQWRVLDDALLPAAAPAFDDRSTWTGSVIRDDAGLWRMFYTGTSNAENGLKQRIGCVASRDLATWERAPELPVLESDPRWYEGLPRVEWFDEAWRDPWVFRPAPDDHWHMLTTARVGTGPGESRGVIGHATSDDLVRWEVGPPLTEPDSGFGHLEVPQVEEIEGRTLLLFSCLGTELSPKRPGAGGIWVAEGESLTGRFQISAARRISDESLYSGRIIRDRAGRWQLLAFRNLDADGRFVGELTDPIPFDPDGPLLSVHPSTAAPDRLVREVA
jgi:beta-fructofuranosidase